MARVRKGWQGAAQFGKESIRELDASARQPNRVNLPMRAIRASSWAVVATDAGRGRTRIFGQIAVKVRF
jgi:hypothetical protein